MEKLTNESTVKNWLIEGERFHRSHGADKFTNPVHLGTGMLYYTLAYIYKAKRCVCLGSGSGFVPRCMRQAQFDLEIMDESETILVDANMPEAGWGEPDYFDKKPSFFKENFDVKIIEKTTVEAAKDGFEDIDYLHIDADHSFEAAYGDLMTYAAFLSKKSVITMHDTIPRNAGVWKVIEQVREEEKDFDVVDLPLNMGVAILTRRQGA
jgi:hypothetical protein